MSIKNIDDLVNVLESKGEKLTPLSHKELSSIESLSSLGLPQLYKDFLLKMGKGSGSFMRGSSVFYDEIPNLKEWSDELLEENEFEKLPENVFVFWMHQGYQLAFFVLGESNNPDVYSFSEVEDMDEFRHEGTFIDFLNKQLKVV